MGEEQVGPFAFVALFVFVVVAFIAGLVLLVVMIVVPCLVAMGVLAAKGRRDCAKRLRNEAESEDAW